MLTAPNEKKVMIFSLNTMTPSTVAITLKPETAMEEAYRKFFEARRAALDSEGKNPWLTFTKEIEGFPVILDCRLVYAINVFSVPQNEEAKETEVVSARKTGKAVKEAGAKDK